MTTGKKVLVIFAFFVLMVHVKSFPTASSDNDEADFFELISDWIESIFGYEDDESEEISVVSCKNCTVVIKVDEKISSSPQMTSTESTTNSQSSTTQIISSTSQSSTSQSSTSQSSTSQSSTSQSSTSPSSTIQSSTSQSSTGQSSTSNNSTPGSSVTPGMNESIQPTTPAPVA